MTDYIDFLLPWHSFFSTMATACATLIGLLFVAMTLSTHPLNEEENIQLMRVARDTLGHFLVVLMTSVMFLVPYLHPFGLAFALFIISIPWTIGASRRCLHTYRTRRENTYSRNLLQTSSLSVFGGIGLTLVAFLILLGSIYALYLLVGVFAALLAAATGTAWFLLSRMRGTSR